MPRKPIESAQLSEIVTIPSISELFTQSWELVRSAWKTFVGIWLVQLAGGVGLVLLSGVTGAVGAQFLDGTYQFLGIVLLVMAIAIFFVAIFVIIWGSTALFSFAHMQVAGKPNPGVKEVYKESKRFVGKYLLTGFLVALVTGLGILFLVVPGLILGVLFGFSVFLLFTDNLSGFAALQESKRLVNGRFWLVVKKILGLVGINIVGVLVQMLLQLVPVAGSIGGFIVSIFLSFITPVYSFLLIRHLKNR